MKTFIMLLALPCLSATGLYAANGRLNSLTFNGSGCPTPVSPPVGFDGQWLTVELAKGRTSLEAFKGSNHSLEESRRNCILTANVTLPSDQRVALERVLAWGQYQLSAGDQFDFNVSDFFQGQAKAGDLDVSAQGPSGRQSFTFDRNISDLNWSACGGDRALSINTSVRVSPQGEQGDREKWSMARLDKIAFKFTYQRCH